MPFVELRWRPRAIIKHRLLVHSKWCKTEKKRVNPAGYRIRVATRLGSLSFFSFEPTFVVGRANHYSANTSHKSGDALVLLSIGYIVVAVYDIMAISWGAQTMGLIVGGRVDTRVYTICYIHGQFHILYIDYFLETSAHKANLGRDNNARIRSLRIEIGQLMRMCSQR
jgi:hypothetical protein